MPTVVFDEFPAMEIYESRYDYNSGLVEAALWDPADNPHISEICTSDNKEFRKKPKNNDIDFTI